MLASLLAVTHEPLSIERLATRVEHDARHRGDGCGALGTFAGVVRATHQGRRVRYLEYEAFDALALKAFAVIESAATIACSAALSASSGWPWPSSAWAIAM